MDVFAFDIETVASDRLDEFLADKDYSAILPEKLRTGPPKSVTDWAKQETIDKKMKDWTGKREKEITDWIMKKKVKDRNDAGKNWVTGKVCCVVFNQISLEDEEILVRKFYGKDEKELLCQVSGFLTKCGDITLTGANIDDFDIPFLKGRYFANGLRVPTILREKHSDFYKNFGYRFVKDDRFNQRSLVNLKNIGFVLGLPKTLDGSMVQELYDEDNWDTLVGYCLRDTEIVKKAYEVFHYGE